MADGEIRTVSLAKITINLTNPTILSVILLALIIIVKSARLSELLVSLAMLLVFMVMVPVLYVSLRISRSGRVSYTPANLTDFLKQHPVDVLALGFLSGVPYLTTLILLSAPIELRFTFVALLATSVIIGAWNLFYHVSYHLAATTTLVIIAAGIWGPAYSWFLLLIPVIGWAKFKIRAHTLPQLLIGTGLGIMISLVVLFAFGLIAFF